MWKIAPFQRGFIYEDFIKKSFGSSNLIKAKNFPVIDIFAKGVATSVKTLDLTAKSYLKGNRVFSTLKSYIDDLSNFSGADWGHTQITSSMIKKKVLEVGIPPGASSSQISQIQKAVKYANGKNIELNVRVIK